MDRFKHFAPSLVMTVAAVFTAPLMSQNAYAAPDCSAAYASTESLWPANHKFTEVSIEGVGGANVAIRCVMQDEALNSTGDGNTEYDAELIADNEVLLRSERKGNSNGRVYQISFVAEQGGQYCEGTVPVEVRHDKKTAAIDDGADYESISSPNDCQTAFNLPPVITSTPNTSVIAGDSYQYQITATDPENQAISYAIETAPEAAVLNEITGLISWQTEDADVGTTSITVLAVDTFGASDTQQFDLEVTVRPNSPPVITPPPALVIDENELLNYSFIATDIDGDQLIYSLDGNEPQGMVVNEQTGELAWQTNYESAGQYSATLVVFDGVVSVQQVFTVTVNNVNRAPVITSAELTSAQENQLYEYPVTAVDADGDTLIYALNTKPPGMSIDAQGVISWTPTYAQSGDHAVEVEVTDGQDSDQQNFTITVKNTNRPPSVMAPPDQTGKEDVAYAYQLILSDDDGDDLGVVLNSPPVGLAVDGSGNISWLPGFDQAGTYTVAGQVTDGIDTVSFSYQLVIENTNRLPVITSTDILNAKENVLYQYQVTATDEDNEPLTYSLINTVPVGMSMTAAGLISWTPDYNQADTYDISYQVTDGIDTVSRTYTLTVADNNRAPVFTSTPIEQVTEANQYSYQLTASDEDNDPLVFDIISAPPGMNVDPSGLITWDTSYDSAGVYPFTATVSDGVDTDTQLINLTVLNANRAPEIDPIANQEVIETETFSYQVIASDSDGEQLMFSVSETITGLSIDQVTGLINWAPGIGQAGVYSITVTVTDLGGLESVESFQIEIIALNQAPVFNTTPPTSVLSGYYYRYNAKAVDPEGSRVYYFLKSGPSGSYINSTTGELSWRSTESHIGEQTIVIGARDEGGKEGFQTATFIVTQNQAPVFNTTPPTSVLSGYYYRYNAKAVDPEGSRVYYFLKSGPSGSYINSTTGELSWRSTEAHIGEQTIVIGARDEGGKEGFQTVTFAVIQNQAPEFNTTPPSSVRSGYYYRYNAKAVDPEGSRIYYFLKSGPSGAYINSTTGELSWRSTDSHIGEQTIVIGARDQGSKEGFQTITISVEQNGAPRFTSTPITSVSAFHDYSYQTQVIEPESEAYTVSLKSAPAGMYINSSGLVTWSRSYITVPGAHAVEIEAKDLGGHAAVQAFDINIIENQSPIFTSSSKLNLVTGENYDYKVVAEDPEGDQVSYELVSGPAGMLVAPNGQFDWLIEVSDIGNHDVVVKAVDEFGASSNQEITLTVHENHPPEIISSPLSTTVKEYDTYFYDVNATDPNPDDVLTYGVNSLANTTVIDYETGELAWFRSEGFPVYSTEINDRCSAPTGSSEPFFDPRKWVIFRDEGVHGGVQDWAFADDNITAIATGNGDPSVLMSDIEVEDGLIEINMRVTAGDDDSIGFVWGFQDMQHYYRFRWHQGNDGGVLVSTINSPNPRFAGNDPTDKHLYKKYEMPWLQFTQYRVLLDVRPGHASIHVFEENKLLDTFEIRDTTYLKGRFGLYAGSQGGIHYTARYLPRNPSADLIIENVESSTDKVQDTYNVSLLNRGGASTNTETNLVLRAASYNANDELENYQDLASVVVPVMAASEMQNLSITIPTIASTYDVVELVVDSEGQDIVECNQLNNTKRLPLFFAKATDNGGLFDTQHFTVDAINENDTPVFTSSAPSYAVIGEIYKYNAIATDLDVGDHLDYELVNGPEGMQFYLDSGLLLWVPSLADLHKAQMVTIRVTDLSGAFIDQTFTVTAQQKPIITSVPNIVARAGELYQYPVVATDPEGDVLTYRLTKKPSGMTINSETGVISWSPATAGEFYDVVVEVTDNKEGVDSQAYTLAVLAIGEVNTPPVVTSQPSINVLPSSTYNYQIVASDADGDSLRYRLLESPIAMFIDETTGLVEWLMPHTTVTKFPILIEVADRRGGFAYQSFVISTDNNGNAAPTITSAPVQQVNEGYHYQYPVVATDPDGDSLSFELYRAPAGMAIDSSGLISWSPELSDKGTHDISVKAIDVVGNFSQQDFTLQVLEDTAPNTGPSITSTPTYSVVAGDSYQYQVTATDSDGDVLNYTLPVKPQGMSIDSNGLISWVPTAIHVGVQAVTVTVSDGQASYTQSYSINVLAHAIPTDTNVIVTPQSVAPGETVTISVSVTNPQGVSNIELLVDGVVAPLTNNEAQVSSTVFGRHDIAVDVTDSQGTETTNSFFTVLDVSDTVAPLVSITTPTDMTELTGAIDVVGSVNDDNLQSYQLYLSSTDGSSSQIIASGNSNVNESVLGELDPTLLINGQYYLLLVATDINNQQSQAAVSVSVEGDLKVGNFSFTVEDLVIPMVGIPVRVTRTYDSRRRHEDLDFGFGWSVGYQDVKVDESRAPGAFWSLNQYPSGPLGLVPLFCVEPNGSPIVTVTLPTGEVERFETAASPSCSSGTPFLDVELAFNPVGDTQSTLTATNNNYGRLVNGNIANLGSASSTLNPSKYELTTRAGYVYKLDQSFGVTQVVDPNGHTLTYSDTGIVHSAGKRIDFIRDSQGRIEKIVDPSGNELHYTFDAQGDLREAQDAETVAQAVPGTTYTYNGNHGLVDIVDPLGRRVLRNVYDADGRLTGQLDAEGNLKTFSHDLDARSSVVTDLDGKTKIYNYDDRGNVLEEIISITDGSYTEDIVTSYSYDAQDNQESKSVGGAQYTWLSDFDTNNNQLLATDPEGNTVYYGEYNARGQEGSVTDERGHTYNMHYDVVGNLYLIESPEVTDPDTQATSRPQAGNVINAKGLIDSSTDLRGHTTNYTYYPDGHQWEGQKHTESNALTGTVTYTYDGNNNVATEQRQRTVGGSLITETVSFQYDKQNRLTRTDYPDGTYTQTDYDLVGSTDKERDRYGEWIDYDYDLYGRLIETVYPDGTKETRTYYREGDLKTVVDRRGLTTEYHYDDAKRLVRTNFVEAGTFTRTEYTPQGWVKNEWDENNNRTEYQYDLAGKRTAVIRHGEGTSHPHSYAYYANGELQSETDALNHTTSYVLNALDQRTQTDYHNGTSMAQRFDAMGARTASIDQETTRTEFGYDGLGRLESVQAQVQVNSQALPATTYIYDEVGNKLTQTDAEGRTTRWTYDYHGRVTSRTLPELMSESFVYDDINRTVTHADFNGDVIVTTHDNMGRVARIDYQKDGASEVFTYWENDQVKTVTDQHGVTQYFYDNRDRLEAEIKPDATRMDYAYDAVGNRTQVKVTRGANITATDYSYDDFNRLATVTDSSGITTYSYDAVGNLDTVSYPNGLVADYDYNTVNQLTNITTRDSNNGNVVVSSYSYALTDTGRREKITEHSGRVTDYGYDSLYRLTSEFVTDATNGNYNASYEYDFVGNRTSATIGGVTTAYQYDDNDRLTSQGGTTYTHDDNGNTLTETLGGVTTTYSYDAKNKMVSVDKSGVTTDYSYNFNGIRTSKTESGITTEFIVDENRDYAQVLEEVVDGTSEVKYSYGHDLLSQERSGVNSFYHYDGLGSTRSLSNGAGVVTDSYDYEAFGEVLNQVGTTENSYLFTGEQFDSSLDQYYLRARYYDQGVGRFTQQDTWMGNNSDPVTLHKYLYANADPVMYTDPTGNFSLVQAGVAFAGLGALAVSTQHGYQIGQSLAGGISWDGDGGSISSRQLGWLTLITTAHNPMLAKLILKKDIDEGAAQTAGQNRAISDSTISERRYGHKRAMIGENQSRVIAAAAYYKAITLQFDSPYNYYGNLKPHEVALSMAYNFGWVAALRTQNFDIYDIGLDRRRKGAVSPWYLMEITAVRGYQKHFPVKWD